MANRTTTQGGRVSAVAVQVPQKAHQLFLGLSLVVLPTAIASVLFFPALLESPVPIPDNSTAGTTHSLTVEGVTEPIASIQVQFNIQSQDGGPMYNGDLYVTLVHDGNSAVLLNRVGRREGFSAGYGDAGFDVTLSDFAPGDIHTYRVSLNGSDSIPLSAGDVPGILTGTWQPDARTADPESVFSTSPRSATLSQLYSTSANGTWSLFVADLSPGGQAELRGWGIQITPVPEPKDFAVLASLLLGAWAFARRHRK